MRLARDERGSVVVFVALAMVPILLLLALVIDAGKWFTHNRQLRNRADAAMQAAGVEYARRWPACEADAGAAGAIVDAAKAYAGGVYNAEITNVAPEDIVVNDDPCAIQPDGHRWLDMEVRERNITSLSPLFELIGESVSAPEAIGSGSRIELLQAASDTGFVPLAIEDQRIVKAQARFFNGCTGTPLGGPVALTPLSSQPVPGMTLWGSDVQITLPSAASPGFGCPVPGVSGGRDHEPVTVQVRLASREEVNLDASCAALIAAPFADCFNDLSQFRAFACRGGGGAPPASVCVGDDAGAGGNGAGDPPDVYGVTLGGGTCSPDPYYARLVGATSCRFDAIVYMNWFDRPPGVCEADLVVDGRAYPLTGPCPRPTEQGEWIGTGIELSSPGRLDARIDWRWQSVENAGDWTCAPPAPPCNESGSFVVHRTNLADDPVTDASPSDIVELVRVSSAPSIDPVSAIHSVHASGANGTFYITVGLKSELAPTQFTTLRTRFPGNRALVCDPAYLGGQTETMVAEGCEPPHGPNPLDGGFWWSGTECPSYATWFSGPPYGNIPWRCIRTELQPAGISEQLATGIAARTGNCSNSPGCGVVQCNVPNRYHEYYDTKSMPIDPSDRRFVKVYVVPFGGFKGPPDGAVPILEIAHFYVTGWGAVDPALRDPCPNNDNARARPGRVAGYFVSTVSPNTGPVEPDSPCDPSKLRPCRAVLTR